MKNLVKDIKNSTLKELGEQVIRSYDDDYNSLAEHRKHIEIQAQLIAALVEKKTFPWENASNIKLPILTSAILQFQSRARRALLPPSGPVRVQKTGQEDFERAVRVQKWFNYQLYEDMPYWKGDMDLALMRVAATGTVFKKTYYDGMKKRIKSKLCEWDSVVMPYGTTCIADATRISYPFTLTERKVRQRMKKGLFEIDNIDTDIGPNNAPESTEDKSLKQQDTRDKDRDREYRFIEQHGYYNLGLDEEDEISEPYIVKVCQDTGYVVSVIKSEDPDNPGEMEQCFTSYTLLPNIKSGVYGWGLGILLEGMNRGANTLINQFVDAGTLANTRGGFIKKRSGLKRGDLQFRINEYKEVDILGDSIRDAIYNHEFKGPDQSLFQVLGLIFDQADKVATISDIATGQMPPRNTPAATVMALIEQGQMVFSTIHERLHDSFKAELAKIYKLNDRHISSIKSKYVSVLGDDMTIKIANAEIQQNPMIASQQAGAAKSGDVEGLRRFTEDLVERIVSGDFRGRSDVIPVSDPNITSNSEKMVKAQEVLDRVLSDPVLSQDPQVRWEAYERYWKALNVEDRDAINPKPEPQEPEDLPPIEEEARWLEDVSSDVLPQQDHIAHLNSHIAFMEGQMALNLTPHGKSLAESHIQSTYAEMHRGGLNDIQGNMAGLEGAPVYAGNFGVA